jgi:heme A synthase
MMTGFQKLVLYTTILTFGLVILGGVVRATDSGLGCPDWPTCHGKFHPGDDTKATIEMSHRLVAGVVSILVVAVAWQAWKKHREDNAILIPAVGSLGVIVVQVILGAITVVRELPPEVVAAHLGTALFFLACLLAVSVAAFRERLLGVGGFVARQWPIMALVVLVLTMGVMTVGAYMTESGASFACTKWPLCNDNFLADGRLYPEGGKLVQVHWFHRLLVLALGFALIALTVQVYRTPGVTRLLKRAVLVALGLYAGQVMLGAANIWTEIDPGVSVAHLALGTTFWGTMVFIALLGSYAPGLETAEQRGRERSRVGAPATSRTLPR